MPFKDPEKKMAYNREQARRLYKLHPERYRAARKKYYYANKEKENEYSKKWNREHRDRTREANRAYYKRNHDKVLAAQRIANKKWSAKNTEHTTVKNHRRRARLVASGGKFSKADIAALKKRQRGKCYYCKQPYGKNPHLDHVWPLFHQGSNGADNIVLSCEGCNLSKGHKTPIEWAGRLL